MVRWSGRPTYAVAGWVFLRLLGVVYLLAFWSLGTQILGLVGDGGILPAHVYMAAARTWAESQHVGLQRYHLVPTLCWISTSDVFLKGLCYSGAGLALLLFVGIAPWVVIPLLWIEYLSLAVVCREFLGYQWDALLLEAGFLAIGLAPLKWLHSPRARIDPPRIVVWLMLWLLFRLMLGSGLVKLASGDPTWRTLDALTFHFETQPIPTPLAFYAHQLPIPVQKISALVTLAIELGAPFLIFGSRRWRTAAWAAFMVLQALIAATGNYAFFNLLAASLCLFLLDDATLRVEAAADADSRDASGWDRARRGVIAGVRQAVLIAVAAVIVPVSAYRFAGSVGLVPPGAQWLELAAIVIDPFRAVNSYGLFAVMTTTRPEIIVEGSDDGERWSAYEFKYKPGDVHRRPPLVAPHQPRLDWQMWFAALDRYEDAPWFRSFCMRLLEGSPEVQRLLAHDPFEGRRPRYVRALLYRYRFADRATHQREGVWWTREALGQYSPVLSLEEHPRPQ